MTDLSPRLRARRRRRRRNPWLTAIVILVVFVAGFGIGSALQERPETGPMQTLVRTLDPVPLEPAARETVTVTVTEPE